MLDFIFSLFGSKTKAYFYLAVFLVVAIALGLVLINRGIELKKEEFEKSIPTKFEDIKTYKDMLIK